MFTALFVWVVLTLLGLLGLVYLQHKTLLPSLDYPYQYLFAAAVVLVSSVVVVVSGFTTFGWWGFAVWAAFAVLTNLWTWAWRKVFPRALLVEFNMGEFQATLDAKLKAMVECVTANAKMRSEAMRAELQKSMQVFRQNQRLFLLRSGPTFHQHPEVVFE